MTMALKIMRTLKIILKTRLTHTIPNNSSNNEYQDIGINVSFSFVMKQANQTD